MQTYSTQAEMEQLIEQLRSSGYHGRDPALAAAPEQLGGFATAIRQLEAMTTQAISVWLDGDMNETESWQMIEVSYLPRISMLESIVAAGLNQVKMSTAGDKSIRQAWQGVQAIIIGLRDRSDKLLFARRDVTFSLMATTMVLRQVVDAEIAPALAHTNFRAYSSNVAPAFFARCTANFRECLFPDPEVVSLAYLCREASSAGYRLTNPNSIQGFTSSDDDESAGNPRAVGSTLATARGAERPRNTG